MPRNIFVLGLDELNLSTLRALPNAGDYRFHQLLTIEELQHRDVIPLGDLIDKATEQLESFDGQVDAVVGYWDFPVTSMVPILSAKLGLRAASLESVVKCEHKYWSRLEQEKAISEYPRFAPVDPFDDDSVAAIDLPYPYWIKPVKAFSSELAHRVQGPDDVAEALADIRENIGRVGHPFDWLLSWIDVPPEVAAVGGEACIAEQAVGGRQLTVEGFVDTDVAVHGVVDSIQHPDAPSFERFQYPSKLPEATQRRAAEVATAVISQIGLNHSCFNIEFFWREETGELFVLEVNPRHSQSHAKLFEYVDGVPNHKLMVDLALGDDPSFEHGSGPYAIAAKWFLRHFADGLVTRAPTAEEAARVEEDVPGTAIHLIAAEGKCLSELHDQDTFSFKLANVYVGAHSEAELEEKVGRCADALAYRIDDR